MSKTNDIVVVDDDQGVRDITSLFLRKLGYNPLTFETASAAQDYVQNQTNGNKPFGYLVDMRIPKELYGSEQLYDYLHQQGLTQNFYFITGNFSDHDKEVQKRTQATVLMKGEYRLPDIIQEMKQRYN